MKPYLSRTGWLNYLSDEVKTKTNTNIKTNSIDDTYPLPTSLAYTVVPLFPAETVHFPDRRAGRHFKQAGHLFKNMEVTTWLLRPWKYRAYRVFTLARATGSSDLHSENKLAPITELR
jgi:hypothetical protein